MNPRSRRNLRAGEDDPEVTSDPEMAPDPDMTSDPDVNNDPEITSDSEYTPPEPTNLTAAEEQGSKTHELVMEGTPSMIRYRLAIPRFIVVGTSGNRYEFNTTDRESIVMDSDMAHLLGMVKRTIGCCGAGEIVEQVFEPVY